jgi:tRNA-splicing ligase RtcB
MLPHSLNQIGPYCFEIPKQGSMRVPARFFGAPALIEAIDAKVFEQAANVACLPGIVKASLAMPDAHWGYGFPIGGVAAFDPERGGVISVGGVGYDISCGVRTMRTGLHREEVEPVLEALVDELFRNIPAGVGSEGLLKLSGAKLDEALQGGAAWAVRNGFGTRSDLEFIEDQGRVSGGNPDKVSDTAKKRQKRQIGTLGSGNHYLEVQHVSRIFDGPAAQAFGLVEGDVVVTLHCGSRALGHQIGTDYLNTLGRAANKYSISLPERELVCAPIDSPEGRDYFEAMVCGINCALANRQVLGHLVRDSFERVLPQARLSVLYDISHNTCKEETHEVQGSKRTLYVHRKGATRAFGPGREELPARYRQAGQPVIIGGTMGTASYILCGLEQGQEMAWGSACHGAGRAMSRRQALKRWKSKDVIEDLREQGILIRAASKKGAAEEAPQAYKDVDLVVDSTHAAGLAKKVAQLKPLACIKG